jgi:hypothetical protein
MRTFLAGMVMVLASVALAAALIARAGEADAQSVAPERKALRQDASFCPSWAEAHERTLASLNNGQPPYAVRWKGCVRLKKGVQVDVVGDDDEGTEIVIRASTCSQTILCSRLDRVARLPDRRPTSASYAADERASVKGSAGNEFTNGDQQG